jgi:large subunit ribosomal protein L25
MLYLQVYKTEIEVFGKADKMPDAIIVDISEREAGTSITAADFNLSADMKVLDADNETYAVIKVKQEIAAEEPKEAKEAKPAE